MKQGFLRKLSNAGITVDRVGGGQVSGNKIGLTVSSGKLDPTNVEGHLGGQGRLQARRSATAACRS